MLVAAEAVKVSPERFSYQVRSCSVFHLGDVIDLFKHGGR